MMPSVTTISSISASPRPCALPPWIWPTTACGLMALPTSWVQASSTTLTRPSSTSTSTTARCAAKAYCTCALPCPVSGSSGLGRAVPPLHRLLDGVVAQQVDQIRDDLADAARPAAGQRPSRARSDPVAAPGAHGLAAA